MRLIDPEVNVLSSNDALQPPAGDVRVTELRTTVASVKWLMAIQNPT